MSTIFNVTTTAAEAAPLISGELYNGSGISLFIWTSLLSVAVYLSSKVFYRGPLTDDKGNTIPDGPMGLPILGVYSNQ